jgi:hemerythrin-like metal-binding protein
MEGYFVWNEKYSVSIPWVDAQHKKIIVAINRLAEAMEDGRSAQVMGQVIESLVEYSLTHFTDEEKMLARYAYPDLADHKRQHQAYIDRVRKFKDSLREKEENLGLKVLDFLKQWLITHILVEDMKYVAFLRAARIDLETA